MSGTIALHGGGEFGAGDEPFLASILGLAPRRDHIVRVAVVPTAAARGRPAIAAAAGVEAFGHLGLAAGLEVRAENIPIIDTASAADPSLAAALADADLIHFPGGDPDLIPTILRDSRAWASVLAALARGAVLAGASAGAMALGAWTWTPDGGLDGLGLAPGITVVPHADSRSWSATLRRFGAGAPAGLAVLGIGERTGVLLQAGEPWRVVGQGEVRWLADGQDDPDGALVVRDGGTFIPSAA